MATFWDDMSCFFMVATQIQNAQTRNRPPFTIKCPTYPLLTAELQQWVLRHKHCCRDGSTMCLANVVHVAFLKVPHNKVTCRGSDMTEMIGKCVRHISKNCGLTTPTTTGELGVKDVQLWQVGSLHSWQGDTVSFQQHPSRKSTGWCQSTGLPA